MLLKLCFLLSCLLAFGACSGAQPRKTPQSGKGAKGAKPAPAPIPGQAKAVIRTAKSYLPEEDGGKDAPKHLPVYMAPYESTEPTVVARLDEEHMLSPKEGIDGLYKVIAQVDEILRPGDEVSAIRIFRDVPPTALEVTTISEALASFVEPAKELGVVIAPDDISVPYPAVVVRPIAVFR